MTIKNIIFMIVWMSSIFIVQIEGINQSCPSDSGCPNNSFCGSFKYCVCENNFIMNCNMTAHKINGNPSLATISQIQSYFEIQPSALNQYLKFSIQFQTNSSQEYAILATLWGQSGYLQQLADSNKISSIIFRLSQAQPSTIDTTYYEFGIQPNGQPQVLYLGLKFTEGPTFPSPTLQLFISANQQAAYNQDASKIIITVLTAIMSVLCLIFMAFCIYKRNVMINEGRRVQKQKQTKDTTHFDQYMPVVLAERCKIPMQICSVCLTDIISQNMIRLTICRHLFHVQCIDSWCKKNMTCPICRQQLDLQNCQRILGDGFSLGQTQSIQKVCQQNRKQVQLVQRNAKNNPIQNVNFQILQQNSMRRGML